MGKIRSKKLKKKSCALRIVIAGGGTGGHLFPGIAIAETFKSKNPETKVLFISTGNQFEISALKRTSFELKKIAVEGIKGRGLRNMARSLSEIPYAIFESVRILKSFKPDLVIGVGSYSSGPVAIGAWLMGCKIVLHEQNILPGTTNRILSHFADRIYVSFKNSFSKSASGKVLVAGNPVRQKFLKYLGKSDAAGSFDLKSKRPFVVLIAGGSQGAQSINLAVMDALAHIKDKDNLFFVHQTGHNYEKEVKNIYIKNGVLNCVKPFFYDMEKQYAAADLVICRAGATTIAEVTALGKGAIFIPYPFAADNHQVLNAKALVDADAAEMILQKDLSGKQLADRIEYYSSNRKALLLMAFNAKSFGRPDASKIIVDDCCQLLHRG